MGNNDEQGYVIICRQPGDTLNKAPYYSAWIEGIHWDNVSGGVHKRQSGYSLYGYIPYSHAKELVSCSGEHDYRDNMAKICICASDNKEEPYLSEYKDIVQDAGPKPASDIAINRPEGEPPCTRKICALLNGKEYMLRKELCSELLEIGYAQKTIRSALKRLQRENRIRTDGSSHSPNQKVFIPLDKDSL